GRVWDGGARKAVWLGAALRRGGRPGRGGRFVRRGVATTGERTPAAEALRLLEAQGFGPVLVLNQAGVLMGAAYRDRLQAAPGDVAVGTVMRFGVSPVRPSEDPAALGPRMGHAEVTRVAVTRSDGTPIGLFFAEDLTS